MTGYHLSIGYMSGATCSLNRFEAFDELCAEVEKVRDNPMVIRQAFNRQNEVPFNSLHMDILQNYRQDGPALRIDRENSEVYLTCSGMGVYRTAKEESAFHACLYLICKMANLGIPVNMVIA